MKITTLCPLALVTLLFACDAGEKKTAEAGAAAEAKVSAGAGAAAGADVEAGGEVQGALAGGVEVTVPPLKPVAEVEAALGKKISLEAADLELGGVAKLVAEGKVKSAAELELLLNAPGAAAHRVDLDADGALDYLQVVEVRAGAEIHFELRAVPSSKLDASLAVLVGTIDMVRAEAEGKLAIVATYAAAVEGGADLRFEHAHKAEFRADKVVLADASAGAFVDWAFTTGRPAYVSVHVKPADISLAADGSAQFGADAAASLSAAQLAALRADLSLEVDVAADAALDGAAKLEARAQAGADAAADAAAKLQAKAEASADRAAEAAAKLESKLKAGAKAGADAGASIGSGVKIGGGSIGAGVKIGGGVSVGGGGSASAGAKAGGGGSAGGKAKGGLKLGN